MLVQIDGSQHLWLEGRGPKLTLLIADATGTVAVLCAGENTQGYLVLLVSQRGGSSATAPPSLRALPTGSHRLGHRLMP